MLKNYLQRYWLPVLFSVLSIVFVSLSVHIGMQLVAVVLTTLAWVYQTRHPMILKKAQKRLPQHSPGLYLAIADTVSGIESQFDMIRADVSQVKAMLADASVTLQGSFANIHEHVSLQAHAIEQIVQCTREHVPSANEQQAIPIGKSHNVGSDQHEAGLRTQSVGPGDMLGRYLSQIGNSSDQIDKIVGIVVRSLQFEDMATQLLDHINEQTTAINDSIVALNHLMAGVDNDAINTVGPRAQRSSMNSGNKVVTQESMDPGDIELF